MSDKKFMVLVVVMVGLGLVVGRMYALLVLTQVQDVSKPRTSDITVNTGQRHDVHDLFKIERTESLRSPNPILESGRGL